MLAQPLNERDEGGRGSTGLSPGLLRGDNDASKTQTGVSSPPRPPCALSSSSPSFLSALPHSPPSLKFSTPSASSSVLPPQSLSVSFSTPLISPSPPSCSHSSRFPTSSVILSPSFHPLTSSASPPPASPTLLSSTPPPSSSSPPPCQSFHPSPLPVCPLSHTSAFPPPITSPALPSSLAFICPPPPFYTSPPLPTSVHPSPTFSSTTSLSPLLGHYSPLFSSAASSVLSSPPAVFNPSPFSPPVSASPLHTSTFVHVSPALNPPPNPPACCSCSSLLPRLLSTHRLEIRRLLRGALSSLSRRLDSLERKRKRRRKRTCRNEGEGSTPIVTSCNPNPTSTLTSSSSLLPSDKDLSTSPLSWSFSQSEQRRICRGQAEVREKKRRMENYSGEEEEENGGRFVGQMRVSVRGGAKEEVLLTLHDMNHRRRKQGRVCPSQKAAVIVRQNGYSIVAQSSQHALHLLPSPQSGLDSCQAEALWVSFSQWHFSDFVPPSSSLSPSQAFSHLQLCSSFGLTSVLLLSAVSMETLSELLKAGALGSPQRLLKDWTAPPSLSSDHCYVHQPTVSSTFSARQQKQRVSNVTWSFYLPERQPPSLYSTNRHTTLFPADQSAPNPKFVATHAGCSKRVSQIRIRRATPRETPLTPMGLPKVQRLKKKEFSLEEIYTNKNFKSPTTNRSLETIFEEPREKDGALLLIGQQRRRRLLLFPDFTQPRKRKRPQGVGLPVVMVPRKRAARRHCQSDGSDDIDLDVMLVERLSALEAFMTQQGLDV